MMKENNIHMLISTHSFLGVLHRQSGKLFYYAMLLSALTALVISVLLKHENPFLFSIGLFSSYFILTGYRALNFKMDNVNPLIVKFISWSMILTGVIMIGYNPIFNDKINNVLTVFGIVGLIISIRDLVLYNDLIRQPLYRLLDDEIE